MRPVEVNCLCCSGSGDNLNHFLAGRLYAGTQFFVNDLRNVAVQTAVNNSFNAVRRQAVVIHIISIIFKHLCFHDAINILEQGGTDAVRIHAAGIVHAGIVAVAEFFIRFPFSTASKRRRVCYSRNTGYRAGVCDGGDRIRRHITIRASACAAERHHDRTLCTNFSIRNSKELDAGRSFNQPSRRYYDPRRASHHDIAAGFLGRQHT